jgi:predicted Zn-dependent protease
LGKAKEAKVLFDEYLRPLRDIPAVQNLEVNFLATPEEQEARLRDLAHSCNLEAMTMLADRLLMKGALEESFHLLNHCLKYEYRSPEVWSLLGELYTRRADQNQDEAEVNSEKAVFCFSKASKYGCLLSTECRRLLALIPLQFIP